MSKQLLGYNVLDAARKRIAETFNTFERIYLSFSAGKDSTVMLHLVLEEAKKRNRKIGILFIDLEGQYKITIDHAIRCFDMYKENIELYWVCLPIHLRNAVSAYEPFWVSWDDKVKEMWIRDLPKGAIHDSTYFDFFRDGMEFEEFVPEFGKWYAQGKKCACFVGIRTSESLNRWRTIASTKKTTVNERSWTTNVIEEVYNIYPIYDWSTSDIWVYHAKFKDKPYNDLYTLMHQAGLSISQMRICQPYGDDQRRGLWLFHLIEPETWSKVVARVNGANSGALYIQESGNINGYRNIIKPEGHTWESFAKLLLSSMPPKSQKHYANKIAIFQKWWMERGYESGIPDEANIKLESDKKVPSWRRVCKSLLRNDFWCKGMSFTQQKTEAYEKYLDLMRRRKNEWNQQLFIC